MMTVPPKERELAGVTLMVRLAPCAATVLMIGSCWIEAAVSCAGETPVNLMFVAVATQVFPELKASREKPPEAGHCSYEVLGVINPFKSIQTKVLKSEVTILILTC
jgi:hypothetical protein